MYLFLDIWFTFYIYIEWYLNEYKVHPILKLIVKYVPGWKQFDIFLVLINHLIKHTHNIIQHDASFSLQTCIGCLQYLTLLRFCMCTVVSNRGWTFYIYINMHIWLYTIKYNNLNDCAADNLFNTLSIKYIYS